MKKNDFFLEKPLTMTIKSSIIGLTLEREAQAERTGRKHERLPGRLKESEMCLVTGPRDFLE